MNSDFELQELVTLDIFPRQSIFIRFKKNFFHYWRARPFMTCKTAVQVYSALIQPHFDYCCSIWGELGDTLATKLQKLQNRAARAITRSSYDVDAGVVLTLLQLENLSTRRKKLKHS